MRCLLMILCVSAGLAAPAADAQTIFGQAAQRQLPPAQLHPRVQSPTSEPRGSGINLTPADAARAAQAQYGGHVLSVKPSGRGYRVKLLQDGEVRSYQINP